MSLIATSLLRYYSFRSSRKQTYSVAFHFPGHEVVDHELPVLISGNKFSFSRAQSHRVYFAVILMDDLRTGNSQIMEADGPVFGACVEPAAVLFKSEGCDV